MKIDLSTYTVRITWVKIIAWIAGFWFFIALILTLTTAIDANMQLFAKKGEGDKGAIIIITTWLVAVVTIFVRHKPMKIVVGLIYIILALIVIIGSMITKANVANAVGWVIPSALSLFVGLWWVLEGFKVIKYKGKKTTKAGQVEIIKK